MSTASRFRAFRECAGLSLDEAARQMGISPEALWDVESFEEELSTCYSPKDVQNFCRVLQVRPSELFGYESSEPPVSPVELVRLIHDQYRLRGITLEQFGNTVGWRLSACIDPPESLLGDITVEGLQRLCRELGMDWRRVI